MTNHKRTLRSITALLLAFVMLFTACNPPAFLGLGDDNRRTIPYSEMVYERPDVEALKELLIAQTEIVKNATSYDEVVDTMYELGPNGNFNTMYSLIELKKYHDSTDTFAAEEYRFMVDAAVDVGQLLNEYNRAIIEGPFADEYRADLGDYYFEMDKAQLMLSSEAVSQQKKDRDQIAADYNEALTTLSVTYKGISYTINDLYYIDNAEDYYAARDLYFSTHANTFADMYARFVKLDKEIAEILGFESAIEMHYLEYARDYTPEEGLAICGYVKEEFRDLNSEVQYYTIDSPYLDDSMDMIRSMLAQADSSLAKCWDYMTENQLHDLEALPNKQAGIGFTTYLNNYDAPFIYMYWDDGDFSSFTTLTHEFGHFYKDWAHYDQSYVFNLDLEEVFSQGLELLLQSYYAEYMGETNAQYSAGYSLGMIFDTFPYQSLIEELQHRIYALDTFDAETIGKVYHQLLAEYGFAVDPEADISHGWIPTWWMPPSTPSAMSPVPLPQCSCGSRCRTRVQRQPSRPI